MKQHWCDDLLNCSRCGSSCHDIVDNGVVVSGRKVCLTECVFCGQRHFQQAIVRDDQPAAPPAVAGFRFKFGRFAGKTLAEADAEPNGRRYLEHMHATNERLRPILAAYLHPGEAAEPAADDPELAAFLQS